MQRDVQLKEQTVRKIANRLVGGTDRTLDRMFEMELESALMEMSGQGPNSPSSAANAFQKVQTGVYVVKGQVIRMVLDEEGSFRVRFIRKGQSRECELREFISNL